MIFVYPEFLRMSNFQVGPFSHTERWAGYDLESDKDLDGVGLQDCYHSSFIEIEIV